MNTDTSFLKTLSKLLLDLESSTGTRECAFLVMRSIQLSINDFQGSTRKELKNEILKIVEFSKNTSPRISLLIFMVIRIKEKMLQYFKEFPNNSLEEDKKAIQESIDIILSKREKSLQKSLEYASGLIKNNDTVLLHDPSRTIFSILKREKEKGVPFTVLVAGQDQKKTAIIIHFLQEEDIPFQVIPEYLLEHLRESIDCCFAGAVTANSSQEIIGDAGTNALLTELQSWNIPVYLPITTDKFSLWEAKEKHHTLKTKTKYTQEGKEYEKLIFSHDRYPFSLITKFVTNKGLLSPDEFLELYNKYYEDSTEWRDENCV